MGHVRDLVSTAVYTTAKGVMIFGFFAKCDVRDA